MSEIDENFIYLKIQDQVYYLSDLFNNLKDFTDEELKKLQEQIDKIDVSNLKEKLEKLEKLEKKDVENLTNILTNIKTDLDDLLKKETDDVSSLKTDIENLQNLITTINQSIVTINDNIKNLNDTKQNKKDNNLETTSKDVVGAINELKNTSVDAYTKKEVDMKIKDVEGNISTLNSAINTHSNELIKINDNINTINTSIKVINEDIDSMLDNINDLSINKQNAEDNNLKTSKKNIVEAINELKEATDGNYKVYEHSSISNYFVSNSSRVTITAGTLLDLGEIYAVRIWFRFNSSVRSSYSAGIFWNIMQCTAAFQAMIDIAPSSSTSTNDSISFGGIAFDNKDGNYSALINGGSNYIQIAFTKDYTVNSSTLWQLRIAYVKDRLIEP